MISRRTFLRNGALVSGSGVMAGLVPSAWAQVVGSNDAIRLGIIGLGIKGAQLAKVTSELAGVRLVALCDVDPRRLAEQVALYNGGPTPIFASTDMRAVFDRADVDAVIIAACTHWHALATLWACQAGKDVYVEKPVGRTVWEGRKIIEASERYGRIVQTGTQMRSDLTMDEMAAYIRSGQLGKIQWMHGVAYVRREPLGRELPWYPDWLDFDHYSGPAPVMPLRRTRLHYDWHAKWHTGNGDLANMGVHVVDQARRFFGDAAMPRRTVSIGGRFAMDDVGDAPNTQLSVIEFDEAPLFFENRALPIRPGATYSDNLRGQRHGLVVQCEHGYFAGYVGGAIFDNAGKKLKPKSLETDRVPDHLKNFLAAVRSRRSADLTAPPQIGHDSARFCHYGNISYRLGQPGSVAQVEATLEATTGAVDVFKGMQSHLSVHHVDLDKQPLSVGPWLDLSASDDGITAVHGGNDATLAEARFLLKGVQRPGYAIPETL